MLQRAQRLAHVMKLAQRRIELASIALMLAILVRVPFAAEVHMHREQNGDGADGKKSGKKHERLESVLNEKVDPVLQSRCGMQ